MYISPLQNDPSLCGSRAFTFFHLPVSSITYHSCTLSHAISPARSFRTYLLFNLHTHDYICEFRHSSLLYPRPFSPFAYLNNDRAPLPFRLSSIIRCLRYVLFACALHSHITLLLKLVHCFLLISRSSDICKFTTSTIMSFFSYLNNMLTFLFHSFGHVSCISTAPFSRCSNSLHDSSSVFIMQFSAIFPRYVFHTTSLLSMMFSNHFARPFLFFPFDFTFIKSGIF